MISLKEIEKIHTTLIETFGGTHGIRDKPGLESALARPFQTFGQNDLYPDTLMKAAALIESTVTNHPFIDGNKRTGYVIMRIFLIENGLDIIASQQQKFDLVIGIAAGEIKYDKIVEWLENHT